MCTRAEAKFFQGIQCTTLLYVCKHSAYNFLVSFVSFLQNSVTVRYPPSVVTLPERGIKAFLIDMKIQVGPFMNATEFNVVKNDS